MMHTVELLLSFHIDCLIITFGPFVSEYISVSEFKSVPDDYTGEVNTADFWDSIYKELIARGFLTSTLKFSSPVIAHLHLLVRPTEAADTFLDLWAHSNKHSIMHSSLYLFFR